MMDVSKESLYVIIFNIVNSLFFLYKSFSFFKKCFSRKISDFIFSYLGRVRKSHKMTMEPWGESKGIPEGRNKEKALIHKSEEHYSQSFLWRYWPILGGQKS